MEDVSPARHCQLPHRARLATGPPRSSTEVCFGLLRRYPYGLAFLGFVFLLVLMGTGKRPMGGFLFCHLCGTGRDFRKVFPEDLSMCFELLLGRMQPPVYGVSAVFIDWRFRNLDQYWICDRMVYSSSPCLPAKMVFCGRIAQSA